MEYKKIIGERIAHFRGTRRLTRPDFMEILNKTIGGQYTTQALYTWEKGKATPPADLVPVLAQVLEVTVSELFGQEPQGNAELSSRNVQLEEEVEKLKKEVEELTGENKKLEGRLEASASFLKEVMDRMSSK